jgi:D-sedoheptulose 7-phosphate isomerase
MTDTTFSVPNYFAAHVRLAKELDMAAFQRGVDTVLATWRSGKKIITCGNGGSAHTASHYITDWSKMSNLATGRKFRGISLVDNVGLITAFGNDLSFEDVFSGQLRALADEGDLVVVVSGSGNSPNVVKAVQAAHEAGADTLAIVGYDGGKLKQIAKQAVWVPCFDMQLCEDVHLMFGHMVMKALCSLPIEL